MDELTGITESLGTGRKEHVNLSGGGGGGRKGGGSRGAGGVGVGAACSLSFVNSSQSSGVHSRPLDIIANFWPGKKKKTFQSESHRPSLEKSSELDES